MPTQHRAGKTRMGSAMGKLAKKRCVRIRARSPQIGRGILASSQPPRSHGVSSSLPETRPSCLPTPSSQPQSPAPESYGPCLARRECFQSSYAHEVPRTKSRLSDRRPGQGSLTLRAAPTSKTLIECLLLRKVFSSDAELPPKESPLGEDKNEFCSIRSLRILMTHSKPTEIAFAT